MRRGGSEISARVSTCNNNLVKVSSMICSGEHSEMERSILVLQRLQGNDFGMHGRGFTITYGFVGSVSGLELSCKIMWLIVIEFFCMAGCWLGNNLFHHNLPVSAFLNGTWVK